MKSREYKIASILMIHGGFMEIGGCLFLIPILLSAGTALILMLKGYFGDKTAVRNFS